MMIRMKKKKVYPRITVLCIIMALIMTVYSASAFSMQIANQSKYTTTEDSLITRTLRVSAARGEILDRYGRPLAYNTEGYNIVFDAAYLSKNNINATVKALIAILTQAGEEWIDLLPMDTKAPYDFLPESESARDTLISKISLNHYATAQNCWDAMIERYKLQDYDDATARKIMGVRYSMEYRDYSILNPYTFAEDVSMGTVTVIQENSQALQGVDIEVVAMREYATGITNTHIVGYTGPIYAEEWAALSSKGYSYNDKTGKSGIELSLDDELHGEDGVKTITQDAQGNVISEEITQQPVNGKTITLTIDKDLQEIAYKSLENKIAQLHNTNPGRYANAGAVVVIDNNTGAVLAAVSYPGYTLDTYKDDYESLLQMEGSPLFNRCFYGTYEPGSAMKPAMALIALQSGNLGTAELLECTGKYTFYEDYQPKCLGEHGHIDVARALTVSCNTFFYELGRRCGIQTMNDYCKKFGLGIVTGIEIGESKGILAGIEYRNSIGQSWGPGDTIQAAIGQSDNGFTPVQIAAYTSTIANKGTLYSTHLVESICNYEQDRILEQKGSQVLKVSGIDDYYYDIVQMGMRGVSTEGTVSSVFKKYPIQVCSKTGTAQVYYKGEKFTNGIFISFAPYEHPEISVVVAIEKGGYGAYCASVARDIYEAYFAYRGQKNTVQSTDKLL